MAARRPAITVRRAEPRDAEAMQAIFAMPRAQAGTLQLPYPSVEMWRKRLQDGVGSEDFVLVAEVDGRVVGNLGLHVASKSPRRRHAGYIGMSVHDDWQGKGVGTALMTAAVDLADNWLDYSRLELTVYTDNAAAMKLYRRFGFEVEGTLRNYAVRDGRYVDAYAMARLKPGRVAGEAMPAAARPSAMRRKATKTARKRWR